MTDIHNILYSEKKKTAWQNSNSYRMIPIYGKIATLLCIFEVYCIYLNILNTQSAFKKSVRKILIIQ